MTIKQMIEHWRNRKRIYSYTLGQLTESEELDFEQHLAICNRCHLELSETLPLVRTLRSEEGAEKVRRSANRTRGLRHLALWHPSAAMAASLAVLILLPAVAYRYAAHMQGTAYDLPLPRVEEVKGTSERSGNFAQGLRAFQEHSYGEAASCFQRCTQESPQSFDAQFLTGLCLLEESKNSIGNVTLHLDRSKALQALDHLHAAETLARQIRTSTGNPRYLSDATYYIGRAHLMLGEKSQARHYFQAYLSLDDPTHSQREEVRQLLRNIL